VDVCRTNVALRVDQRVPLIDDLTVTIDSDRSDLDDAVVVVHAGRLDIHDNESIAVAEQYCSIAPLHSEPEARSRIVADRIKACRRGELHLPDTAA
jgi:hypothetical protein